MLLRQRLVDGLKEAMKAKDKRRSLVIKSILSDITLSDKSTKPDEPALILQRGIKKRLESIAAFATRPDLADNERMEIEILKSFLPRQLSKDEIHNVVQETINQLKATKKSDLGRVMVELNQKIPVSVASRKNLSDAAKSMLQ
jgi:uncharacterized protein YqeY